MKQKMTFATILLITLCRFGGPLPDVNILNGNTVTITTAAPAALSQKLS